MYTLCKYTIILHYFNNLSQVFIDYETYFNSKYVLFYVLRECVKSFLVW